MKAQKYVWILRSNDALVEVFDTPELGADYAVFYDYAKATDRKDLLQLRIIEHSTKTGHRIYVKLIKKALIKKLPFKV